MLRAYPAAWRREFGAEFEDVLRRLPLSVPVVLNVFAGGISQRLTNMVQLMTGGSEVPNGGLAARYDQLTKIVSVTLLALLIAVPVMAMPAGAVAVIAAFGSVLVIGLSYAYSPRGYEISGGEFRIKRLIGDVVFPLERLRFVRATTDADFWGSVRLWGSGGLFGYYGWFWSKALGRSSWYVTDRSKAVIVTDGDRVILVSPDDRDVFLTAIRKDDSATIGKDDSATIGKDAPTTIAVTSLRSRRLAIAALALTIVAATMLYSPGRPAVDLTRDSLVIHSLF